MDDEWDDAGEVVSKLVIDIISFYVYSWHTYSPKYFREQNRCIL